MFEHPDDEGFHYSSDAEIDRYGAYQEGANRPDLAWIASDRDVWYPNPFYVGPPVPHPESIEYDDLADQAGYDGNGLDPDDDIPF